jgi:hypothetical protein
MTVLAAFAAGWFLDHAVEDAWAAPPTHDLLCRTFKHTLENPVLIETSDRTSEVGQWVAEQRGNGWELSGTDFEVTQKPNGFPMGFVQVCLKRR